MYDSFLQQSTYIACHLFAADQTRSFVEENSEDLQRAQAPFKGLAASQDRWTPKHWTAKGYAKAAKGN